MFIYSKAKHNIFSLCLYTPSILPITIIVIARTEGVYKHRIYNIYGRNASFAVQCHNMAGPTHPSYVVITVVR